MPSSWVPLLLIAVLLIAAMTDFRSAKIPNWLTMPMIAAGLVSHALAGGWSGFMNSLQGFGLGFGLFLTLYWLGGLGAGDVKLVAAIGSVMGPAGTVSALMAVGAVSGVYGVCLMLHHWGWRGSLIRLHQSLWGSRALVSPCNRLTFRFGPVIALGTILSLAMNGAG